MGCRSFLTDWQDPDTGEWVYEGRFNKGVVSINLPQVGLACGGDIDLFWETFDQRLELCHQALLCKNELLKDATAAVSPIHWQHGGIARLNKHEDLNNLLEGGYSTISLGYIGLYELTQIVMGCSHTTEEGKKFALSVVKHMKEKCNEWNEEKNLGFGLYGTPAESLCYRFAKIDRATYGIIPGVTDKEWYTNSYHVCPMEEIDAMSSWQGSELNKAKEILAYELTKLVHGDEEAEKAQSAAKAVFGSGDSANMPSVTLNDSDFTDGSIDILSMLVCSGLVPSKSEARRAVEQGGVTVDGEKITDIKKRYDSCEFDEGKVLKRGKKNFIKLVK
jgi:hypothetical protein